jgi:hypothetical protein
VVCSNDSTHNILELLKPYYDLQCDCTHMQHHANIQSTPCTFSHTLEEDFSEYARQKCSLKFFINKNFFRSSSQGYRNDQRVKVCLWLNFYAILSTFEILKFFGHQKCTKNAIKRLKEQEERFFAQV